MNSPHRWDLLSFHRPGKTVEDGGGEGRWCRLSGVHGRKEEVMCLKDRDQRSMGM